jgi:hypothetical protein
MQKTALLLLLVAQMAAGQAPRLIWKSFHAPDYPRDAQIAHVIGLVTVEFTLNENGTATIGKTSGHPLLIPPAVDTIKSSELRCSACDRESVFIVYFNFSMADHNCQQARLVPAYTAKLRSADTVSVIAEPVCTEDPVVPYVKKRSFQCLYLWKCRKIWLQ